MMSSKVVYLNIAIPGSGAMHSKRVGESHALGTIGQRRGPGWVGSSAWAIIVYGTYRR
jgi:hypothetical protein